MKTKRLSELLDKLDFSHEEVNAAFDALDASAICYGYEYQMTLVPSPIVCDILNVNNPFDENTHIIMEQ